MIKAVKRLIKAEGLKNNYLPRLILSALIIISSFASFAQYDSTRNWLPVNAEGTVNKNLKVNGGFIIPRDTPTLAVRDSGGIAYKGGKFWVFNGYYWIAANSGTVIIGSPTIDSVTFTPTTTCTWLNNVSTCQDFSLLVAYAANSADGTRTIYYNLIGDSIGTKVNPHTDLYEDNNFMLIDTLSNAFRATAGPLMVPNLADLQTVTRGLTGTMKTAFVTDSVSGGTFTYSASTLTDDYGIIFPAYGGGHWVRDRSQSQYVNIRWFGILPTNTAAQNTTLITSMLAALPNFATVFVPTGDYHHNGIIINKPVNFVGESKFGSKLMNDAAGVDAVTINAVAGTERCKFEDIAVFGNGTSAYGLGATTGNGISFHGYSVLWDFNNVWMRGHGGSGFYADSTGNINNINISNSQVEWNKGSAIHFYQRSQIFQINAIYVTNCNLTGNNSHGVEIWGANITIERNTIQANHGYAITLDGTKGFLTSQARGIVINANYYEACDSGFLKVRAITRAAGTRFIYGVAITNNFGGYFRSDPGLTMDGRNLAIVDIDAPGGDSYNSLRINSLVYTGNSFNPGSGSDTLTIPILMNAHNVLGNESFIQRGVFATADIADLMYLNLGQATVSGNGNFSGTGHPNNRIPGRIGDTYQRRDSGSLGYQFYVKKFQTAGQPSYNREATAWYPFVDTMQMNTLLFAKQDKIDHHIFRVPIIGGTSANDSLIIQGNDATSSNTSTNTSIKFNVGNSGATNAIRILNNGYVGVGMGNIYPKSPLSLASTARLSWDYNAGQANSRAWALLNDVAAYGDFGLVTTSVQDYSFNTVRLYLSSIGQLGIGTTSPSLGDGTYSSFAAISNPSAVSNFIVMRKPDVTNYRQGIYFQDKASNSGWNFGVHADGTAQISWGSGASETAAVTAAMANKYFTIGQDGTVGVGAGKFQVDINGNITKINNVSTSFPSSNVSGVLTNNGSGILTWVDSTTSMHSQIVGLSSTVATNTTNITARLPLAGGIMTGKLSIATGSNKSAGTSTLTSGTVTISTTAIATGDDVIVIVKTPGGTQGFLSVPTASIVNGTSFIVNSSSASETSTFYWEIRGH